MHKVMELQVPVDIEPYYEPSSHCINLSWKTQQWRQVLAACGHRMVRELNLKSCGISDQDIELGMLEALCGQLHILTLSDNKIEASGLALILKLPWDKLAKFNIISNFVEDEGMLAISAAASLPKLQQLNLDNNRITHIGLAMMPAFRAPHLTYLTLNFNRIGAKGMGLLAKAQLPALDKIELYKCAIGAQGIKFIGKAQWPNLKHLNINGNQVGSAGHQPLCNGQWPKLTFLSLWESNPVAILCLVGSGWGKGTAIDKDVYQGHYKKAVNKIFKARFMK